MRSHRLSLAALMLVVGVAATSTRGRHADERQLAPPLPDKDFWRLTEELSESNGYFRSDNLLSNEIFFENVIPELVQRTTPGDVYIGVGPEQNFTYIAALKPQMAFIPDIRRGNLDLQLMYKALFELSANRAEFVSRLFSRKRPAQLTPTSTVDDIFAAYVKAAPAADDIYSDNLKAIEALLAGKHGFALSNDDRAGIAYVYGNFHTFGPDINYNSSTGGGGGFGGAVSYADLMVATDGQKVSRSFLASEEDFAIVKNLEEKNLIVPLVGDIAGPKMVRALGRYLRDRSATVAAFYVSNVEQFLYQAGTWKNFCRNVASLPLDAKSTFIRSTRSGGFSRGLVTELGAMKSDIEACAEGR